ncbi:MAG: ribulose-phosphate 3-epimerase [Verrucomicrobia bacterium CG22_combo_CG10-13_8_21_14_all_43_17]|nr:MAG: ribulose-phosphate 3-epimerase [Verrucomicrobia bacterium CG1_02_43_26]PIP59492.1 MAG: ribulose-phosphate 3-epimerase [Verrucomicrobia bacterium CG22_combo_CG10-13_8_21_14_all_43_17]
MSKYPNRVAPSILAGDHARMFDSLKIVEASGVEWLHLDIMDGHFVPNLSFGPQMVSALRKESKLYFDTHLMLDNPDKYIEAFATAGSNNITIHVEPDYPIMETLSRIRRLGCSCGIALNPGTAVSAVTPFLGHVDLVLAMTVQPGFGGQSFREDVLPKIDELNQLREQYGYAYRIEVDGGIDIETSLTCKELGSDTFVAGTAFFKAEDKKQFVDILEK